MSSKSKNFDYKNIIILLAISFLIILLTKVLFGKKIENFLKEEIQLNGILNYNFDSKNNISSIFKVALSDLRIDDLKLNNVDLLVNTILHSPVCKDSKSISSLKKPIIDRIASFKEVDNYSLIFRNFFFEKEMALNCKNALENQIKLINSSASKFILEYRNFVENNSLIKNQIAFNQIILKNLEKKNIKEFEFYKIDFNILTSKSSTLSIYFTLFLIIFILLFFFNNYKLKKKIFNFDFFLK